jgi:hypothetical protein
MVKVADFGLAQLSGISGFAKARGGTIGYMPPEQLQQQEIDCRSDLWAFAALLYQLLTGFNPFQASSIDESLQRILNDPLPLPSELRDDLDPAADTVIVQALMAAKELRPDNVSEFIGQLLPLLGKPEKGHRQLKLLVNNSDLDEIELSDDWHQEDGQSQEYLEDVRFEDEQPPDGPTAPPWQRMPRRLRGALGRLVAAAACGVFAFTGLSGFGLPQRFLPGTAADGQGAVSAVSALSALAAGQLDIGLIILIGVIALVAVGALIAHQLGSALAVVIMVAGLFTHGLILFGIAAALLLAAWWLFFGRHGGPDATVVMLTPLLGALCLSFALPMLAGYYLPWRRALAAAGTQGLLLIILAASTGSATIVGTGLVLSPLDAAAPIALTASQAMTTDITPAAVHASTAMPSTTAMYASTALASSVGSGIAGFVEMLLPGQTLGFLAAPLPWVSLLALMLAALLVSLPLSHALRRESQGQSKGSRGRTGQKQGRAAADDKDDLEIDEQSAGRSNLAMFFCLLLASLVLAASCIAVPEFIAAGQDGSNTINLALRQANIVQQSVGLGLSFILLLILSLLGVPPSTGRIAVPTDETAG